MTKEERAAVIHKHLAWVIRYSGITRRELAKKSGIPKRTLDSYVDGTVPSALYLAVLCEALEVNPAWVLGLSERRGL